MDIRVVFMGTPDFAVPTLKKLAGNFQVAGVVTQPDRRSGRGQQLIFSAVKQAALDLELEVFQPENVNTDQTLERIKSWNPDLICVAAFGQIIKPDLLDLPIYGCLNVHASLLPRWRGASPINAAILAGDTHSGVTIMKMGPGLDDGPILTQKIIEIGPKETAGSLSTKLAELGASLLVETIPLYLNGQIDLKEQDPRLATRARMLRKSAGELDFSFSAEELARTVRAYAPWPGTYTFWEEKRLIIHQASAKSVTSPGSGVLTRYEGAPAIGTNLGVLVLEQLQLAGKKRSSGFDFLNGNPDWPQEII